MNNNTIKIQLLRNLLDEVSSRYDYLYNANRQILKETQYAASHDSLTGLVNRASFEENLARSLSVVKRHGGHAAVLFIDLDNFKQVNDTIGHDEGDRLLCKIASAVTSTIRKEDIFARFGGDEFAILIERVSSNVDQAILDVSDVCQKILACTKYTYHVNRNTFTVTGSIGVVLFGTHTIASVEELIHYADVAMYEAKKQGKNQAVFFDEAIKARLEEQIIIEQKIRDAIKNDAFILHYQPKISPKERVIGVEALVRIQDSNGDLICTDHYIPLCEKRNLMSIVSEKILIEVCKTLKTWEKDPLLSTMDISININPAWLYHPTFVEKIEEILRLSDANLDRLIFEITKSTESVDIPLKIAIMEKFMAMGVRFALDDFGTGHSSLVYLSQLPFHEIKIDHSFIAHWDEDASDISNEKYHRFIKATIAMAKSLGLKVTIEGVETAKVAKTLWDMGCDTLQGILYASPVDQRTIEAFIHRKNS
jgi:diguanylate cyclase (GGDEF)-like protein